MAEHGPTTGKSTGAGTVAPAVIDEAFSALPVCRILLTHGNARRRTMLQVKFEPQHDNVLTATTDRRAFVRYYLLPRPPVPFLLRSELHLGIAILKDASLGSIGLLLDHPAEVGSQLIVQLPGRPGSSPARTAVVVRMEQEDEGNWLAGCRLSPMLTEEELRGLRVASPAPEPRQTGCSATASDFLVAL
jgi:hypothetical protein